MDLYKYHNKPEELKGHHEADERVPARIFYRIHSGGTKRLTNSQKSVLANDPEYAYRYATYVLQRRRFKEGEPAIAKIAKNAFQYAHDTIRGPWPEGEAAIARDAHYAYLYARYVIKKRWPKGEPVITKNLECTWNYIQDIIRGPWPEAEDTIAKDSQTSFDYAIYTLDGRFKKGEAAIAKNGPLKSRYEKFFMVKL